MFFLFRESTANDDEKIQHISTVPRSQSNDLLKKEITIEKGSFRQSFYNTLQRGKNRLRQMTTLRTDDKPIPLPVDKDVSDIDDFNINETLRTGLSRRRQERRSLHDKKPFYSSSECNTQPPVSVHTGNSVKIRESSNIRRQRRNGLGKDEPNSSSGNWSASSESGRTSIGSEITTTTHPKSSTSSSSLNHHHVPSSGPPSSIISRRRFLNTSASSSVTSEGTATPDLQTDFHDEDGSSSVYSCDTEGYYTSFHVDSGLKTLKEEEPPTPNRHSSTTSFESSSNQTVISPENEYELFGRGSTSTTTSSAGTVCTAVLADQDRNAPLLPERKSSLTKLHRSGSSVSEYNLERSCSTSTVGSTLEGAATIKRNGVLLQKGVAALVHQAKEELQAKRNQSPDSGNNTSSSPVETNSNSSSTQSQQGTKTSSEFECSESSDLECSDRIERMRTKTTINTSRIPSMCVITPGNSDDDEGGKTKTNNEKDLPKVISIEFGAESSPSTSTPTELPFKDLQHFKKSTLLPLNTFIGRLKEALPSLKKSPIKEAPLAADDEDLEELDEGEKESSDTGEYVTIKDNALSTKPQSSGIYYSNDVVKRNLATVLSGNLDDTEYVSLNELPCNTGCIDKGDKTNSSDVDKKVENQKGQRVTMNAHGQIVYNSDSLKRRKSHTTFMPGPYIKDSTTSASAGTKPIPPATTPTKLSNTTTTTIDNDKSQLKQNDSPIKSIKSTDKLTTTSTTMQERNISNPFFEGKFEYIDHSPKFSPKQQIKSKFSLNGDIDPHMKVRSKIYVNNSFARDSFPVKRSDSYRKANYAPLSLFNHANTVQTLNNNPLNNNVHSITSTFNSHTSANTSTTTTNMEWSSKNEIYIDKPKPEKNLLINPMKNNLLRLQRVKTDEGFVEESSGSGSDDSQESRSLMASIEKLLNELSLDKNSQSKEFIENEDEKTLTLQSPTRAEIVLNQSKRDRTSFKFNFNSPSHSSTLLKNEFLESEDELEKNMDTKPCSPVSKVTLPPDSNLHKARILENKYFNESSTDIW